MMVVTAAATVIILTITITAFLIYKKKRRHSKSETIELEPEHIVFKKQKLDILKCEMNSELKNKRKISGEFDKTAMKLNKNNQLVNQGDKY